MAGHAGAGGDRHICVVVVSAEFEGLGAVRRFCLVANEFAAGLHTLSLDTRMPAEAA